MADERAGKVHPGEPRLPAAVGVLVAILLYAVLPSTLLIGPRFVIPGLELLLFIPLVLANPRRMSRENRSSAKSGWAPGFIDYLYISVTNSSAFSPTDTMPLSVRAKLLMAVESVSALMLSVLVVSFAVGLLGQ